MIDKTLNELVLEKISDIQNEMEKANQDEEIKTHKNFLIELHSKIFEKAQAYTNAIIIAGYAGAFAILNLNKNVMDKKFFVFSSIMLIISISVFIIWEVLGMMVRSRNFMKIYRIINTDNTEDFTTRLKQAQLAEQKKILMMTPIWIMVVSLVAITALAAISTMVYSYTVYLING